MVVTEIWANEETAVTDWVTDLELMGGGRYIKTLMSTRVHTHRTKQTGRCPLTHTLMKSRRCRDSAVLYLHKTAASEALI